MSRTETGNEHTAGGNTVALPERLQPTRASRAANVMGFFGFVVLFMLLAQGLPEHLFDPASKTFILFIGVIGIWRYGWWFIHVVRAVCYRRFAFPRLRAEADAVSAAGARPERIYVLVTSYQMKPEVTFAVYDSLVRNAVGTGVPTTIVAAVSDRSDVDVLAAVLAENRAPAGVEILYMFQRGDGKRSAMAEALRAIARRLPGPDDLVVFMDGDIRLPDGTFERSMPFFFVEEDLGAVTTDNGAVVAGGDATKEWYNLKYAQRHLLMSSLSLSRRVLVLTGRYSVIRAPIATEPDFIAQIEHDEVSHWRFGTFRFLSGDDKSSWFWLLKRGWAMRYIPDVTVFGFEELPGSGPEGGRFFDGTRDLMRRWHGNMLRNSRRAIALGPGGMGLFTWWNLVDQRLSVWTTLIGPTVAVLLSLFVTPLFAPAYLLWVMTTRLIASAILGWGHGRWSPLWVPLLYYNQVVGAAIKSAVIFRLNQQRWVRQGISTGMPEDRRLARRQRQENILFHAAALTGLVLFVAFASGALAVPDGRILASLTGAADPAAAAEPPIFAGPPAPAGAVVPAAATAATAAATAPARPPCDGAAAAGCSDGGRPR